MNDPKKTHHSSAREKFLSLSLESTRKSYYPQLREQLEEAKNKENRLKLLIDNLPARIAYVSREGKYILVNREYQTLFGVPRDQIIGRSVRSLIGDKNYHRTSPYREMALAGNDVHFESEFDFEDGRVQFHEISYIPMADNNGKVEGFYVLAIDVTEKKRAAEENKRLMEQLHEAQKFKAIGTLAGGIAHDFNNLLMGIQGRASLLSIQLESTDPLAEHIRAIEEHVSSATNLTKQLLGFARGGKYEVKPVDLNEIINNSAFMFGRTRKQIAMHKKMAHQPIIVEVDKTQIEQVLLNLFVNAWQAMPTGGDLYIKTGVMELDPKFCRTHEMESGFYGWFTIADTGTGMSEEIRQRVFDPFFTTREKQRGTGLGLASAYGIIKNHGGHIHVSSTMGEGSTFYIYLPLSDKAPIPEVKAPAQLVKGDGHILLVDDEPMILEIGRALLESLGYQVSIASSGEQASQIISDKPKSIDLVILDMIMPGLDGGLTFDRIRAVDKGVKIILSSGYSLDGQAQEIITRGCEGFIQKPFTIAELSVIVSKVFSAS
jgi:two-component system cell cycle sensor histidine kinase/response regulator CckA